MSLHLIGASGFIGQSIQHLQPHNIHCWSSKPSLGHDYFDIYNADSWSPLLSANPDTVILLSWPGLPNYSNTSHLNQNLPANIKLVEALVGAGCKHIIFAGTCYEYGLQYGPLGEDLPTQPCNHYSIAKDALRRAASIICMQAEVRWTWFRIFYPYGEMQRSNSLYPSLLNAINSKELTFSMSSAHKIRDFIPISNVASAFINAAKSSTENGVVNLGSGIPQSLEGFARKICSDSRSQIKLNFGVYPDRQDEPLAFWANTQKAKMLNLL